MQHIEIKTHGATAEIYGDGVAIHPWCTGYVLKQSCARRQAVLELELLCPSIQVEGHCEVCPVDLKGEQVLDNCPVFQHLIQIGKQRHNESKCGNEDS